MNSCTVTFDNGNMLSIDINGTASDIIKYFLGHYFNVGAGEEDLLARAVKVEVSARA